MAIALDVAASSTDQTASPITWNHTVGNGANSFLAVGVGLFGSSQPTATAVTYGGVSMTKARGDQQAASIDFLESSIWFLFNPLPGTNQVSVTASNVQHAAGTSVSYFNVKQTSVADAVNGNTGTTTGDKTFTVTTVADSCWIFLTGINCAGTVPTLVADQTSRGTVSLGSLIASLTRTSDTNAAKPGGANTVGMTVGASAAEDGYAISAASFAPASNVAFNNYQFAKDGSTGDAGYLSFTEKIR